MNALWTAAAALLLFVVISRMRRRTRHTRAQRAQPPTRTITGYQINAYLDPRMPSACLYDHGIQYGVGFRRKEGPTLPHGEACQCQAVSFSFSSQQVFNGALRAVTETRGVIPGLSLPQARFLIDALKQQEARSLPATVEQYAQAVDLSQFGADLRQAIAQFLQERFAHLQQQQQTLESPAAEGTGQDGERDNAASTSGPDAGTEAMDGK